MTAHDIENSFHVWLHNFRWWTAELSNPLATDYIVWSRAKTVQAHANAIAFASR